MKPNNPPTEIFLLHYYQWGTPHTATCTSAHHCMGLFASYADTRYHPSYLPWIETIKTEVGK